MDGVEDVSGDLFIEVVEDDDCDVASFGEFGECFDAVEGCGEFVFFFGISREDLDERVDEDDFDVFVLGEEELDSFYCSGIYSFGEFFV